MRPRTDRQTDTQTRVTTIHFASSTTHAKFRVSRRRREMYSILVTRVCVCVCACLCVCLSLAACPLYCTDPDVTWGCPHVVHYWADFQSVYGFRCPNAKCQRVLVGLLAQCLVITVFSLAEMKQMNAFALSVNDRKQSYVHNMSQQELIRR